MAGRLADAGLQVTVWNRTRAKADVLRGRGISVAQTPGEAVRGADVVLLVVLDEEAVDAILCDALPDVGAGALVLNLSTSSAAGAGRFAGRIRERGGRPAYAPFFGSVPEAERGALWFTVGCEEKDFSAVEEALRPIGEGIVRVGDVEAAAAFKLAANVLVFTMVALIAEAIALARAQGVDPELLLSVLARGTGVRAPIYQARGRLILDGDYTARASVQMALKDLELIASAADETGLELPLTAAAHGLFRRAAGAGYAEEDMAAVYKVIHALP